MNRLTYVSADDLRRLRLQMTEEIRHCRIVARVMDTMQSWIIAFNDKDPQRFTIREAREMMARVVAHNPDIASARVVNPPTKSVWGETRECKVILSPRDSRNLEFTLYTEGASAKVDAVRSLTGYGVDPAGQANTLEQALPVLETKAEEYNKALRDLCRVSEWSRGLYPLNDAFGRYVLPTT